jgi:hypothetical protein
MSKPTITRFFVGGIVAVVAGFVIAIMAVIGAWSGNVLTMDGPDVTGIRQSPYAATMLALLVVGGVAMIGGAVAGLVSWIGALLNTAQLEDKAWFVVLLVLGLFSFGFVAMIAYVIAGPDGTRRAAGPLPVATA